MSARLAGLPPPVLANARDVLARLEHYELDVFGEDDSGAPNKAARRKAAAQASLFDLANQRVVEEIRAAPAELCGEEARELLRRLKEQLMYRRFGLPNRPPTCNDVRSSLFFYSWREPAP